MKTPKEKADELINLFEIIIISANADSWTKEAVQCAIICCKEVLGYMGADRGYEFWTSVLYELEHYGE